MSADVEESLEAALKESDAAIERLEAEVARLKEANAELQRRVAEAPVDAETAARAGADAARLDALGEAIQAPQTRLRMWREPRGTVSGAIFRSTPTSDADILARAYDRPDLRALIDALLE